ncbi:Phosphatidylglycerol/phosphatidylinositol transfer protein, variant 3 [Schistosoma haematobium]|uniref:Phosphatidylglycerol/phosphatidylinositol transfer protein, variant 3 n=1 Tax=Schistosoma haematobium TaxID=6185 RepID=A0A922S449_SCHHA|nr:Phosphatidylglycerol/phosphatidylinositol transfer protein, variant 3 [Schistosoma haematobium]KAH9592597.1 Phosphatidylglycerol/phosphatidylinositol transfer protein, variant 3 [Schistosoma haematobium]
MVALWFVSLLLVCLVHSEPYRDCEETVKDGHISVHGVIAHVPVPFPLDNSELCNFVSPVCPLIPSIENYTHTYSLYVSTSYPSISLTIRWELQDSSNEDIVCVEFPVQLI